jgi:hypothetical protein
MSNLNVIGMQLLPENVFLGFDLFTSGTTALQRINK